MSYTTAAMAAVKFHAVSNSSSRSATFHSALTASYHRSIAGAVRYHTAANAAGSRVTRQMLVANSRWPLAPLLSLTVRKRC